MPGLRSSISSIGALVALLIYANSSNAQEPSPSLTTIYSFQQGVGDGEFPQAALAINTQDVLYGTTEWGGAGYGTVFRLIPPSNPGGPWTESVLYPFTGGADGGGPLGTVLLLGNGGLATTSSCYAMSCLGAVLTLSPNREGNSWRSDVLYEFFNFTGGAYPRSGVISANSAVFYGTTSQGGSCTFEYGCGVVYSVENHGETPLYNLQGHGGSVSGLVMDSAGVLYGTATDGTKREDEGYVFSVTPPAGSGGLWTGAEIHRFGMGSGNTLGQTPLAAVVIGDQGTLYGTTSVGAANGSGAVFSLTPPAAPGGLWSGAVLYSFPKEGQSVSPGGLVYDVARNVLYGVTLSGGSYGKGTAFSLSPPSVPGGSWTCRLLHVFTGGSDGFGPNTLAIGNGGVLYGTTQGGGIYYSGTVFSLKP